MRRRRNGDNRPLLVVLEAFKGFVQKLYDARKALDASQATATAKEQAERVRAAMQKLVLTLGNSDVMRREIDDDSLSAKDVLKSHMQRAKSRNAMQKGGFFSRLFGGNKRDSTSGGSSKNLAQKIDRAAQRESQAQRAERMKHVSELCALIELPLLTPPSSGILPEGPRNDDKLDKLAMSLRSLVANPRVMLALHRSCTSTNPGAEPENVEAKRQLIFFCNSLHNSRLLQPPCVKMMRSVSSFTPHFYEDVTQSMTQLQDSGAESASMLSILSALYPDEWENLRERIDMEVGGFGGLERRGSNVGNVARAGVKRAISAGFARDYCSAHGSIACFDVDESNPQGIMDPIKHLATEFLFDHPVDGVGVHTPRRFP